MIKMQQQGMHNKMTPFEIAVDDDRSSKCDIFNSLHQYIIIITTLYSHSQGPYGGGKNMGEKSCFSTYDYVSNVKILSIVSDIMCKSRNTCPTCEK